MMADECHSLESLQELHADLVALSESRLSNVHRLAMQLEEHVHVFRALLDKKPRSEQSRKVVQPREAHPKTGTIEIGGNSYNVNNQFREGVLEVADSLDLDEVEAAQLFLDAQEDGQASGQPVETCAIIRFHQGRKEMLDCLRITLELSSASSLTDEEQEFLSQVVAEITRAQDTKDESRFARRCLSSMSETKVWIQQLVGSADGQRIANDTEKGVENLERMQYQRASLIREHELLGVIVFYLAKRSSVMSDFEMVLETLRTHDAFDSLLLHWLPPLFAYISRFGGPDGDVSLDDARRFNDKLLRPSTTTTSWKLVYLHAAVRAWWLAEYSGWYGENYEGSLPQNQLTEESNQRSRQFAEALKDGAFDCMVSISADMKGEWYDPAREGLRSWLQRKAPFLQVTLDSSFSGVFQDILMDQLQTFAENFILNLPNVLRKLRFEEDEQRQSSATHDQDVDMERFLVIISYIFDGRPKAAADGFWDNPDGGLMGFIYWVSTRASTPLVSAFCEMLQAISQDEDCATSVHEFLVDEGPQKTRRLALTWNHIIKELTFFSKSIRDRPAVPQGFGPGKSHTEHAELEPETYLMLEEYLRVIARVVATSPVARDFFISHPTFQLHEILFLLVSSAITPRIRAAAFTALRSLLSNKTKAAGEYIWTALDGWISGGYSPGSSMAKVPVPIPFSAASTEHILRGLSNGFEEPNAFVQLLSALISPFDGEIGLNDGLPFPENLGAANRMPGIEPYVDFVLGQTFSSQHTEIYDVKLSRMLQLSCLDFIALSLDTFNEDLVIFQSRTSVDVEFAIDSTDLKTYVLLHPFARVMEWMFNERVMTALFSILHQDPVAVANASQDSPLMRCVLQGIHVVSRILELQATYLDIVRPLFKGQSSSQRGVISSAAYASFEDGILSHLPIIADLGLYCGAGQPELVMASLELLEKLSTSTKLASVTVTGMGRLANHNKAIAALEVNNDCDTIARSLLHEMKGRIDPNYGADHTSYAIQVRILDFLAACLKASPGHPTIAHLLLGFKCANSVIDIDPNSSFSQGVSLFHCILEIVMLAPVAVDASLSVTNYLMTLKAKSILVLSQLWQSPLSSGLVMDEMRNLRSIFFMFGKQIPLSDPLLFDGRPIQDPELFKSSSATVLSQFLNHRATLLQYVSAELRQVTRSRLPSLKSRIFATLLGSTDEDGQLNEHVDVFGLFDFIELEFPQQGDPVLPAWIEDVDFSICLEDQDGATATYNLDKVIELLILRKKEMTKRKMLEEPEIVATVDLQIELVRDHYATENELKVYRRSRLRVLQSWAQLMLIMIESNEISGEHKAPFMLQILQLVLPSLENRLDNVKESMELAHLAKSLLFSLDFDSKSFKQGDIGDAVSDRLFHLFQVSLKAISSLGAHPDLKEIFYTISYRYLTGMSDITGISKVQRRHSTQTIKAAGDRFVDLVCDDAHSGEPMCRISALLLLNALVKMADREDSRYVVESLGRMNFTSILVESIQNFANDLRETPREDVSIQLSYCHAKLSLLLQLSQTRLGATSVINAGIMHSIQASGLFATDPDLGVDIDIADAISKHYDLLTSLVRVVCAVILSRGSQNAQTLEIGRRFLTENKLSIMAVLKKSAGIGTDLDVIGQSIDELADSYMVLMSITSFIDLQENSQKRSTLKAFT